MAQTMVYLGDCSTDTWEKTCILLLEEVTSRQLDLVD